MNAIRTLILAAALALVPAAASAQNFLINPCGGANTCFGTGDAREAYIVTDGAKRIKVTFGAAPAVEPIGTVTLGTAAKPFSVVYATSFVGSGALGATTFTVDGIGTTSTRGLTIQNTTAAAAGAQQYSPMACQVGQGWKTNATAASQSMEFCWEVQPVQGTSAPTGNFVLSRSINGGAFSTVGTFTSAGAFTASTLTASGGSVIAGSGAGFESANGGGMGIPTATRRRFYNNGSSDTFDIDLAAWGTTLSAEAVSVADAAVLAGPASGVGRLSIAIGTDNRICEFELTGTNAPVELIDGGTLCSVTKDTASSINVYFESAAYRIQNLRGGARALRVVLIGG